MITVHMALGNLLLLLLDHKALKRFVVLQSTECHLVAVHRMTET
jgi:hypothetical protein